MNTRNSSIPFRRFATIVGFLIAASLATAQEQFSLSTGGAVTVDGSIGASEYPTVVEESRMRVSFAIVDGVLYIGARAETTGWVAVGIGSTMMDGAHIFFSYVDGGEPIALEQVGEEHRHQDTSKQIAASMAVAESSGSTTLEVAVPMTVVDTMITDGVLPFIYAYGTRDSVRAIHRFNKAAELVVTGVRR